MPMTEAHNRATRKYQAAHIDQMRFDAPKGFKERVQQAAQAAGVSPSQYMREAVLQRLEADAQDPIVSNDTATVSD